MTLKQAKITREYYQFLIGRKAKNSDSSIYDIIVVPDDNPGEFIEDYRMNMDEASNDEMLLEYQSNSYSVQVVYDTDPEFVDLYLDDISLYKDEVDDDEFEDDEVFDDDEDLMETNSTDIVWDVITESAKSRFDYQSFSAPFDEVSPHIADNLLFKTIISFVNKEEPPIIAAKLKAEVMMLGLIWKDVENFVENKKQELQAEIFATQLAHSLLEQGNQPLHVVNSIKQLLN